MDHKVYLGIPTHDGRVGQGIVNAILSSLGPNLTTLQIETGSSITFNFNNVYCKALNARKTHGVTHFLMLHEDIWPQKGNFLTRMLEIMDEKQADILSVVMRLKTENGLTSTAIEEPSTGPNGFRTRKLNLKEIAEQYETTFTDPMLLINTGLMLIDIRHAWAERIHFEFKDMIAEAPDGTWYPCSISEDYGLSRMARKLGLKMYATTEIEASHCGGGRWNNKG